MNIPKSAVLKQNVKTKRKNVILYRFWSKKWKTKSSRQKEEIFMKSDKIMKSRKNAIFHYTCCKTRSNKEVLKPKTKKKRPEMKRKKSNISFDLLQNMSFWSISRRKKKCPKGNISFDLLQNTRFHRPAPPKPGWWKKQYFVWLVAKDDFWWKIHFFEKWNC